MSNLLVRSRCFLHISASAFAFLYEDPRLDHEARSLFCSVAHMRPESVEDLIAKVGLGHHKVTRVCRGLVGCGWLRMVSKGRIRRPVCWVPQEYQERLVQELQYRYDLAHLGGEFLFGRILEYLVDVPCFIHNARPKFLEHPKSKERLELDFFAPGVIGGEFHGQQHYTETEMYPKRTVDDIKVRDLVKEALCARSGLPLIIVKAETLSISSVMSMLPADIPIHDFDLSDPYPQKMDNLCTLYRRKVQRILRAAQ